MNRREARQVALRALYQMDVADAMLKEAVQFALEGLCPDASEVEFVTRLTSDTWELMPELDERIRPNLKGWTLERIPITDLCILRLALCEILTMDTPVKVVINEAVELAKEYGTSESGRFVNGVLASLAKSLDCYQFAKREQ